MTRSRLDLLLTYQTLKMMQPDGYLLDSYLADCDELNRVQPDGTFDHEVADVRNVCAKVHVSLSDRIDSVCTFLGISKRQFLEAAFIEAVDRAKVIMESEGVHEYLANQERRQGVAK